MKSKIKWAALGGLVLSFASLLVHLFLAKSSADLVQYTAITVFTEDLTPTLATRKGPGFRKLWGNVKSLEPLQPYPNPRSTYPVAVEQNNGFIYANISGSFEKIRNSIVDLVAISRLLNATLVIPEIQESARSKGISSNFKSFSYLYNEDQFIAALANDVTIVKNLPPILREARRRKEYQILKPKSSASLRFYTSEVLPRLKKAKVIGLILTDGGCLQITYQDKATQTEETIEKTTMDDILKVMMTLCKEVDNLNKEILQIKASQQHGKYAELCRSEDIKIPELKGDVGKHLKTQNTLIYAGEASTSRTATREEKRYVNTLIVCSLA